MGHRVGKILSIGCKRQSAVRSSIRKNSLVPPASERQNLCSTGILLDKRNSPRPLQKTYTRKMSQHRNEDGAKSLHVKARCEVYPRTTDVKRCPVPDDKVPWEVEWIDYAPIDYTSATVLSEPEWADSKDPSGIGWPYLDKGNKIQTPDEKRFSFMGLYDIVDGFPRNPKGRTGCTGRGSLGRWGPNHAADPIVTRWKRDEDGNQVLANDGKPILQFISVLRRDCKEWALPGGMVNPGENRTVTLRREFGEEALNTLEATDEEKIRIHEDLKNFFNDENGAEIYAGYVDDPRNTDNAWMETKAMHFHDENGKGVGRFKLNAGDDAADVKWSDIHGNLKLYASHIDFIKATVDRINAHWLSE